MSYSIFNLQGLDGQDVHPTKAFTKTIAQTRCGNGLTTSFCLRQDARPCQQSYLKRDIIKNSHYTKLIAENRLTKAPLNNPTEFTVV
ncbi:MAG TPA: hypothetical protein V6D11_10400 [Waterburya sp.]